MLSTSLDAIKFKKGPAKHPLTKQEAREIGAGTFTMRLRIFNNTRDTCKVTWIS